MHISEKHGHIVLEREGLTWEMSVEEVYFLLKEDLLKNTYLKARGRTKEIRQQKIAELEKQIRDLRELDK